MKKKNQILLSIIGVVILIVAVIGVSFAFFNYTRTGSSNTLQVGRIAFNTTQTNIELENVFPTLSTNLNSSNSDTATITITGDTTYSEGIEYKVTIEAVNNTINGKEVPISFNVTASNLGTKSSNYYNERGSTTNVYKLTEEGEAYNGKYVLVGYIKPDTTGVDGSIDITAYIDTNKIVISDTYDGTESDSMGTTNEFVAGREVFTTTEWNSFNSSNPLSFKVKVEAQEGTWVEREQFLTMTALVFDSNWSSVRSKITSIEFHNDGVAPANYVTSFDVTDDESDPSKGNVTLYTVDDGLGNNTYKAIIVANDDIYLPTSAFMLFYNCSKLQVFNAKNLKVDNTFDTQLMFYNCKKLQKIIGLSTWNTSGVQIMGGMFYNCESLESIDGLSNWNTSNVYDMNQMFVGCTGLKSLDLSNWDMSNVTNDKTMFQYTGFETIIMPDNYTRIDDFMFNHNDSYTGESFTIPKTVTTVGNSHIFYDFGKDSTFKKFIVESGSTSLKIVDDVLYTYDGTRLISIPRGKAFTNKTFEIPEGVTFMNELSFSRNQNIDTLILPNSYEIERYIDANNNNYGFKNTGNSLSLSIYLYTSIKMYEVKNDNTRYMSDNGCIYSKDGTELIAIPLHYDGVLNIKSGTTTIGQQAFWTVSNVNNVDGITQINIPASVTSIDANQLTFLNSLMSRSANPVTITIDSENTAYQITNNQIVAK